MKIALVTGGSRGIGRSVCLKLAEMNYHVLVNFASNVEAAQETIAMIQQSGRTADLLKFDVARSEEIEHALENWYAANPGLYIEVLINNAGIRKDALMMWMKNEEWTEVIDTNMNGLFYLTRRLVKDMLINKYGRIVNVVSLSGIKGLPGQVNYSAAKAGVIGMTKALAQEVGKKNVTVNAVAPGYIKTDMTKDLDENMLKQMIPVGRFGNVEEVSDVVAFLASPKASYVTGEVISVNGGIYT